MTTPRCLPALALVALVWALGLSAAPAMPTAPDGDADGVPDERDACLYSPPGVRVGPNGCSTPGDEDEDQVADALDLCPYSPAGALVDAQGCALDHDLDGVADGVDRCPGSMAGVRVDARGCTPGATAAAPAPRMSAPMPAPSPAAPAPVVAPVPAPPPLPVPVAAPTPPAAAAPVAPAQVSPETTPVAAPTAAPPVPASAPTPEGPTAPALAAKDAQGAQPDRTVYFEPGESELGWSDARAVKQRARELAAELERDPALRVLVSGHGDIKFDGMSVPRVAAARAAAVRDAMVAAGVPAQRISMRVAGILEPRFHGAAQARNCRAEVRLSGPGRPMPVPTPVTAMSPVAVAGPAPLTPAAAPAAAPTRALPDPPPPKVLPDPPPRPAPAPAPARPAPPASAQGPSTPRALARASVTFEPFSAVLGADAIQALNGFVQAGTRVMLADAASEVLIVSGIGPGEAGASAQRLAESRAASISAYLVSLGLPHSRVAVSNQAQTGERRADVSVVSP